MTPAFALPALLAALALAAAAPAKPRALPGLLIDLQTQDGWALKAKYVPAREGRLSFILLHGTGRRMEDWAPVGRALAGWGYGYIAPDLRGHGLSTGSPEGQPVGWRKFKITPEYNEFANMTLDAEAAASYLAGRGAAEESVGLIGADLGGSLALKYAAIRPKTRMVVMLSPGLRYQEVLTVNAMRAYKNRPILLIHGAMEKGSTRDTGLLARIAKLTTGEANTTVIVAGKERGLKMLTPDVIRRIIDWIADPVRPPETGVLIDTMIPPVPVAEPYPDAADALTPEASGPDGRKEMR